MRIRLVSTTDRYTKLKAGDEGTVTGSRQDPWGDTVIYVKWDSGSTLSLIEGEDAYEVLDGNS